MAKVSPEVELHCAYVWDCDSCGRENFERAIEGDCTEPVMRQNKESVLALMVAEERDCVDEGDGFYAPEFIAVISLAPKRVLCRFCGQAFGTKIAVVSG